MSRSFNVSQKYEGAHPLLLSTKKLFCRSYTHIHTFSVPFSALSTEQFKGTIVRFVYTRIRSVMWTGNYFPVVFSDHVNGVCVCVHSPLKLNPTALHFSSFPEPQLCCRRLKRVFVAPVFSQTGRTSLFFYESQRKVVARRARIPPGTESDVDGVCPGGLFYNTGRCPANVCVPGWCSRAVRLSGCCCCFSLQIEWISLVSYQMCEFKLVGFEVHQVLTSLSTRINLSSPLGDEVKHRTYNLKK